MPICEALQTLAPAPAKVLRVIITGRNPGRRDNIAPRETMLIAELKIRVSVLNTSCGLLELGKTYKFRKSYVHHIL